MSNEVSNILLEIQNMKKDIFEMENKISHYKKKISNLQCDLWEKCDHQFIYDTSANFDDRTKYICKICGCYRNSYYYIRRY